MENKPELENISLEPIKEESKLKNAFKSNKNKAKKEIEEDWHARYLDANDKLLRLYADFDNFRKRTAKEKMEISDVASASLIVSLLPVIDDFERALKHTTESDVPDHMQEGMMLIYNKLSSTLESKGLKAMDAMNHDFDTDFHEAITNIPASSEDLRGKVVDQIEKGYTLNGKVIRFAKVIVGI
ncbi:MAG: nucleotide exchange factor GrpE [Bacteroidota bacterium]